MNPRKTNSDLRNQIAIISAQPADRLAIENLMQLYTHDFSEHWVGLDRGELDDHGRFSEYMLDPYWDDPKYVPLLVRRAGRLIGFVLLNQESHSGLPVEHNMAEFFIVRKHRRDGVGTYVAHEMFSRYPGQWETSVARRNTAALTFWRQAIRSHPCVPGLDEHDIDDAHWNGFVLRFVSQA